MTLRCLKTPLFCRKPLDGLVSICQRSLAAAAGCLVYRVVRYAQQAEPSQLNEIGRRYGNEDLWISINQLKDNPLYQGLDEVEQFNVATLILRALTAWEISALLQQLDGCSSWHHNDD